MKFKNETKSRVKYRTGTYTSGFEWKSVDPDQIVDIPFYSGKNIALTPVKDVVEEKPKIEKPKEKVEDHEQKKEDKEVDAGFRKKQYKEKLVAIKGVGKKSAEDIIKDYPTQEILKEAIKNGEEIHNYDNVDAAVKRASF